MADNRSIHKFKHGDEFHERYVLDRLIGSGGFADVWKATDTTTNTVVALKIYTNLDEDGIKDLSAEYVRMKDLNHTNILRAEHFDTWGNIPYLVMKLCEGGSLNKRIGQLTDEEILNIIKDMASGLAYLHENKIIHQDIKPANILIDPHGTKTHYVLSDFGISAKTKTQLSRSVNQKNLGTSMTEAYAPPEKFSNKKEERRPDRKGDIFSLGISVYEMATGNMPFDDLATGRQLYYYEDAAVDFSEIKNEKVRRIVEICMQRDKDQRPSAEELVKITEGDKLPDAPVVPEHPSKKTTRVSANSGGGGGMKWILMLLVAVGLGALVYLFINGGGFSSNEENGYVQHVDTFTINGIMLEMVKIPGGTFTMGSDDATADEWEKPARERSVGDFYIGKYEVSQKLWQALMGSNPSTRINDSYPVNNVSWDDCQLFIQKLNAITGRNFRLPTETEWEYAAKGKLNAKGERQSVGHRYAGTTANPGNYGWYSGNSNGNLHAIGLKRPNDFGLYDMSGNVIEWCQDIFTNYATGDVALDRDQHVIRGGYYDSDLSGISTTNRGSCKNNQAAAPLGFRLCM